MTVSSFSEEPAGEPFRLAPERRKLRAAQLQEFERIYETGHRQLRRWWNEGAPLEDPRSVVKWWQDELLAGRKTWSVPDKLLRAAAACAPAPSAPTAPASTPAAPAESNPSINLEDYDPEEGGNLRELKQLRKARWQQISAELKDRKDVAHLQKGVIQIEDMISRIEARIEDRLKKRGLYVPVADVTRDLAKLADMMRQMTDTEERRVLELCPHLPHEHRPAVATAIRQVAASRLRILRSLRSIPDISDALRELTAA